MTRSIPSLKAVFCLVLPLLIALPQVQGQVDGSAPNTRQLQLLVAENEVFAQAHTGFVLYDLATQAPVYAYQPDHRFVPASNVKLLTFFVAQRLLGNRAPGLFYQEFPDRTEAWGTGYPLTLHPDFAQYDELRPWLLRRTKPLVLNFPTDTGAVPRYGAGWSWDDFNDAYVYERSAFPLYGNKLYLDLSPVDAEGRQVLLGSPPSIAATLQQSNQREPLITRSEFGNDFTVGSNFFHPSTFPIERPLHLTPYLIANELASAYPQMRVTSGQLPFPQAQQLSTLEVSLPDTLYRRMLQESDNFLAEHLLLQAASQRYFLPDAELILAYARDTLLPTIGIKNIRWADGSGLSRYSLLSPRHFAQVLMALDREVGRARLLSLLAAGGESGTLKNRFDGRPETYVWAKTGTLRGVSAVSGILKTRRGRWLAFSFLHNNFVGTSRPYFIQMERTLEWCYDNL